MPQTKLERKKLADPGSTSSGGHVWKPKAPAKPKCLTASGTEGIMCSKPVSTSAVEVKMPPGTEEINIKCKVCSKTRSIEPPPTMPRRTRIDPSQIWYSPWRKRPENHHQIPPKRIHSPPNVWAARGGPTKKETPTPNYVFMLFSFPPGSFLAYQLFAAKLLPPQSQQSLEEVVSFPSDCFPSDMCCVHLNSKLYFLGGDRNSKLFLGGHGPSRVQLKEHPRQVYILELSILLHHKSGGGGRARLKKGWPMNTGKPSPYAMTAKGKIYIVSPIECQSNRAVEDISRFEVFHPDSNVWEVLPEAPDLGLVYGHAEVGDKILMSVHSGQVFYYDVAQRYWGKVSPEIPFLGVAHYVDDVFYAHVTPSCKLTAFTSSSGTEDPCRCEFDLNTPTFDPGFDCKAGAELQQGYSHLHRVIHRANGLIYLGNHTFCCVKLYTGDPEEDCTVKIAAFHASHGIKHDFRADILHFSEFSVPISKANSHEFLCFIDACSVPFVREEEYKDEALFQSYVDMNCETSWEISVEEDSGKDRLCRNIIDL